MPILRSDRRLRLQQLKSHDNIRAAVNSLLALLALLEQGIKLCSISRALAISYDKELVHGLNDLYDYLASLVKHKRSKMLKIDPYSIQLLVLNKDRKLAKGLIFSGEAFSGFTSAKQCVVSRVLRKLLKATSFAQQISTDYQTRNTKYIFAATL
ncbi:hypothetical protein N7499_012050 [Penicillium canescens]|nr:hypothetical protein N7499_012050 [Penicillium canescens]KAJ6181786.1 hypothetical protein N7485_000428 [Penicillium canescens]